MKKNAIVTQIGSLPFDDVGRAVEYSLRHDIPFLPELPKRGDAMLSYIKNPGKLSCLEEFKKNKFKTVKIQCVGPATLLLSGYGEDEAVERACEHITAILDGLEAEEVILFLDEPALGQSGADYRELWEALFASFSVIPGVHTCGNMDWDIMFDSPIKFISFDASKYDLTKYSGYRSGKSIAWGVEKIEDVKDFRDGDLLTLPCGIGSPVYKVGDCEPGLKRLQDIAAEIVKGA
ncbi:MAG: hypothetical protein A2Z72_00390 [Omnitrophica bacterium RBG_13_46_9]|nr:MAG: hypothetical protein A2Z72_00390 [Omnitrophica bacterium RBG_13_46_9]